MSTAAGADVDGGSVAVRAILSRVAYAKGMAVGAIVSANEKQSSLGYSRRVVRLDVHFLIVHGSAQTFLAQTLWSAQRFLHPATSGRRRTKKGLEPHLPRNNTDTRVRDRRNRKKDLGWGAPTEGRPCVHPQLNRGKNRCACQSRTSHTHTPTQAKMSMRDEGQHHVQGSLTWPRVGWMECRCVCS